MRFLVCGDIHARNKPEGALTTYRRLVRAISAKAIAEGCQFVFFAGDLIHEKHCVLVEMLIYLYEEFAWARARGVTWVLMPGNHDIPAKHKPTVTILHLFRHVARVYTSRAKLKGDGWSIYLNPWRLPEQFKAQCKDLAQMARMDDAPFKIHLAHIGLAEGQMSPSNTYRVASAIRVADLMPQHYDMTLCADYHTTQQLHDKVWYMGAPIAHIHGDVPGQGVWLVDTQTRLVQQKDLPGEWPEFITRSISGREEVAINPKHNYKIRVTAENRAFYEVQFRGVANVKLETVGDSSQSSPSGRRLEGVMEGDTRKILKIWLGQKQYSDPAYYEEGDEYLSRAEKWLYEHRA